MEHKDFPQEQRHLAQIIQLIQQRLDLAKKESQDQEAGLQDIRRDDYQERSESVFHNLFAAQRFEDLLVLSEEIQSLTNEENDHQTTLKRISSLKKMLHAPYFARIDLQFEEDEEAEEIFIGRASLWDDKKENLLIYDWRAPIASTFYRFGVGKCFYQAPAGKIECNMTLKRQYEIAKGEMLGYFDADTVIQDSFLRKLLAQNASRQMKAIVETIQKDQDTAIRDEDHDLLMVQGAAGSGKTSIAMHRVAYLMYEGLKNPLHAHNILILSPNTIFERYISQVLPELGESTVATATLEQLFEELIGQNVESRAERWEKLNAGKDENTAYRASLSFKSSPAFFALLDRLIEEIPRKMIPYQDLYYAGQCIATRDEIRNEALKKGAGFPLAVRLKRIEDALWEKVHTLHHKRLEELNLRTLNIERGLEFARGYSIFECGALAKTIHSMTQIDWKSCYYQLLNDPSFLRKLGRGLELPDDLSILSCIQPSPDDSIPLEDAAALAYLHLRLDFHSPAGDIRQVVVDECQDYSLADYGVLNLLFPKARFTVVGDINQALDHSVTEDFYDQIAAVLGRKNPALLHLNRSFRCTENILNFSLQFLDHVQIDSLSRPGDAPAVLPLSSLENEIQSCRKKGYQSIALICKTAADAMAWEKRLPQAMGVKRMGYDANPGDVFLVPLALSKGLEFDAVLILDCDDAHYHTQDDRRLLYVACTRALHHLSLLSSGPVTSLVRKEE